MIEAVGVVIAGVGGIGLWAWCARTALRGRVGDRLAEVWGAVVVGCVCAGLGLGIGYREAMATNVLRVDASGLSPRFGVGYTIGVLALCGMLCVCIALLRARSLKGSAVGWAFVLVSSVLVICAVVADELAVIDGLLLLLVGLCWSWWRGATVEHDVHKLLGDRVDAGWIWAGLTAAGALLWSASGAHAIVVWVASAAVSGVFFVVGVRGPIAVGIALCAGWVGVLGGSAWGRWIGAVAHQLSSGSGLVRSVQEATVSQPLVVGVGGSLAEVLIVVGVCIATSSLTLHRRIGCSALSSARVFLLPCIVVLCSFVALRWWVVWG